MPAGWDHRTGAHHSTRAKERPLAPKEILTQKSAKILEIQEGVGGTPWLFSKWGGGGLDPLIPQQGGGVGPSPGAKRICSAKRQGFFAPSERPQNAFWHAFLRIGQNINQICHLFWCEAPVKIFWFLEGPQAFPLGPKGEKWGGGSDYPPSPWGG